MLWTIEKKVDAKWFWFIKTSDGEQLFFHATTMEGGYPEFESTPEGTEVEFEIENNEKTGRPQAANVRVVEWSFRMAA